MNTGALCARMHDRMHHYYDHHHLDGPNVARGAPKAKFEMLYEYVQMQTIPVNDLR